MAKATRHTMLTSAALAFLALLVMIPSLQRPVKWTPDGLFYQARVLELRGATTATATQEVFAGQLAAKLRKTAPESIGNPVWVQFERPFYERRLIVPLVASAIYPLAGDRAIQVVSIAGFIATIVLLFLFLRLSFTLAVAVVATCGALALPPLREVSALPLTDSWGVALSLLAVILGVAAVRGRVEWIAAWALALGVLGFTRDSGWVVALGAGFLAIKERTRRLFVIAIVGLTAVALAPVLFHASGRDQLAFVVGGNVVPTDSSWGFIARHYPDAVLDLIRSNAGYIRRGELFTALYLLGGVAALFLVSRGEDQREPTRALLQTMTFAGFLFLLALPNFTAFRLELVFLPMAAYGIALVLKRLAEVTRTRRSIRGVAG